MAVRSRLGKAVDFYAMERDLPILLKFPNKVGMEPAISFPASTIFAILCSTKRVDKKGGGQKKR